LGPQARAGGSPVSASRSQIEYIGCIQWVPKTTLRSRDVYDKCTCTGTPANNLLHPVTITGYSHLASHSARKSPPNSPVGSYLCRPCRACTLPLRKKKPRRHRRAEARSKSAQPPGAGSGDAQHATAASSSKPRPLISTLPTRWGLGALWWRARHAWRSAAAASKPSTLQVASSILTCTCTCASCTKVLLPVYLMDQPIPLSIYIHT